MYIPIDIPIELVELVKFVLPEIAFVVSAALISILLIILISYSIYRIRKDKKEKKNVFISFSKEEWENFLSILNKQVVKMITDDYDLIAKKSDLRRKLCGAWCEDDCYRYYIRDLGSHYGLMVEDRYSGECDSYILRCAENIRDHNLFTAIGEDSFNLLYDEKSDQLMIVECQGVLNRLEEMESEKVTTSPQMSEIQLSDVEFSSSIKESENESK